MNFCKNIIALMICGALSGIANTQLSDGSPFSISAKLGESSDGIAKLTVQLHAPAEHYFYAEFLEIKLVPDNASSVATNLIPRLIPQYIPSPIEKKDPISEKIEKLYYGNTSLVFSITNYNKTELVRIAVWYQGCNNSMCFPPATTSFVFRAGSAILDETKQDVKTASDMTEWKKIASNFKIVGKHEGYMNADDFIYFLDSSKTHSIDKKNSITRVSIISVLLIILWGLALNLTPCVLPMIPVNLAIIGAGTRSSGKWRGFLLGTVYGLGMMIAYGVLGVVVVLSGAMFGTLSSSPWFNAGIAILFIVLVLAMLEVISIDFSRFQPHVGVEKKLPAGSAIFALIMGAISAILAGACVAPAVISVLTLSLTLYNKGTLLGLFLPFLLGLGMALPWPLAGAGLAILPKPGKWMNVVRYVFAGIILIASMYYGKLALEGFRWRYQNWQTANEQYRTVPKQNITSLLEDLSKALQQNKPVLIDFWASWCKNCIAMEKTTFPNSAVQQKLSEYIVIKYRMEAPNKPEEREVRKYFGFTGLPAFVILKPNPAEKLWSNIE